MFWWWRLLWLAARLGADQPLALKFVFYVAPIATRMEFTISPLGPSQIDNDGFRSLWHGQRTMP